METLIGASCPSCGAFSGMCRCDTLQENKDLKARVAELEESNLDIDHRLRKSFEKRKQLTAENAALKKAAEPRPMSEAPRGKTILVLKRVYVTEAGELQWYGDYGIEGWLSYPPTETEAEERTCQDQ